LIEELNSLSVHITFLKFESKKNRCQQKDKNKKVMINQMIFSMLRLFSLMVKLVIKSNIIMIHSGDIRRGLLRYIVFFMRLNGAVIYSHNKIMTTFFGRDNTVQETKECGDGVLIFGIKDNSKHSYLSPDFYHIIGYPKLYYSWISRIKEYGKKLRHEKVSLIDKDPKGMVISLFLCSIVDGVFNQDDYNEWLNIVFEVLEDNYPHATILIKPHPPVERYKEIINNRIKLSSINDIYICDVHAGIIASGSDLVISAHSSIMIDAMSVNTPTVFHQRFTDHWILRHPEHSSFLHFGLPHSSDRKSLLESIRTVMASDYRVPDIEKILGHQENISVLYK